MTSRERAVLDEALRLTTRQRARLVAQLLASIEGPGDGDAEASWRKEVTRRARRAHAGKSAGIEWESVHARLLQSRR